MASSRAYSSTNGYGLPSHNREPDLYAATDGASEFFDRASRYGRGPGKEMAWNMARRVAARVRANLAPRRLLNFPHLLVVLWMLVLLWGQRWAFTSNVQSCDWDHWEKWVSWRDASISPLPARCMGRRSTRS
jgi:hypothetical protein